MCRVRMGGGQALIQGSDCPFAALRGLDRWVQSAIERRCHSTSPKSYFSRRQHAIVAVMCDTYDIRSQDVCELEAAGP